MPGRRLFPGTLFVASSAWLAICVSSAGLGPSRVQRSEGGVGQHEGHPSLHPQRLPGTASQAESTAGADSLLAALQWCWMLANGKGHQGKWAGKTATHPSPEKDTRGRVRSVQLGRWATERIQRSETSPSQLYQRIIRPITAC